MEIQIRYEATEDRLLLTMKVDARVLAFWLTRRCTGLLWQALWRRLGAGLDAQASADAKPWLLSLQRDAARQTQQISKQAPLQPDAQPLLIQSMEFGSCAGGLHGFKLSDGSARCEQFVLDDASIHALITMLEDVQEKTDWRLDLWRPAAPDAWEAGIASITPPGVLH